MKIINKLAILACIIPAFGFAAANGNLITYKNVNPNQKITCSDGSSITSDPALEVDSSYTYIINTNPTNPIEPAQIAINKASSFTDDKGNTMTITPELSVDHRTLKSTLDLKEVMPGQKAPVTCHGAFVYVKQ